MSHPLRHVVPRSVRDALNEKIANASRDAASEAIAPGGCACGGLDRYTGTSQLTRIRRLEDRRK
jgi:hypothetical protein